MYKHERHNSNLHVIKVGTFAKNNKGLAKFGLKALSSLTEIGSKAVGFIPGIGKPLSKAMEVVSTVENVGSKKIHANFGSHGKLEKGMNIMNKADKMMKYIPIRRDLSEEEEEIFERGDDAYYFEKRHDIPLTYREESYVDADKQNIY